MSKKPIYEVRMGLIKASVWKNQTRSGERHNVTVARLYKNGDVWKESSHFGRDDLLTLAKVIDQAHTWIVNSSSQTAYQDNPECSAPTPNTP